MRPLSTGGWPAGSAPEPRIAFARGAWTADAFVGEAALRHVLGAVDVAQVHDYWPLEQAADAVEVEGPERLPLGDDDERVRTLDAAVGAARVLDVLQYA